MGCYDGVLRCMITTCSGFLVFISGLNLFKRSSLSLLFVFACSIGAFLEPFHLDGTWISQVKLRNVCQRKFPHHFSCRGNQLCGQRSSF